MEEGIRTKNLRLLDQHRIMTLATLPPDGWPQATTVGYVKRWPHSQFHVRRTRPAMIKLVDVFASYSGTSRLLGQGNPLRAGKIAPELDNTTNRPFSFLISSI